VLAIVAAACSGADDATTTTTAVSEASSGPRPVIVDTDMGPDDVLALAVLLESDAIDVLAITIAGVGVVGCETGVRNALALLELTEAPEIPVACGEERNDGESAPVSAETASRANSFYGLPTSIGSRSPAEGTAAELIAATLAAADAPAAVVALAPFTNLAQALATDPALADSVDVVYHAAAIGDDGTDATISADEESARVVLAATNRFTTIPPTVQAELSGGALAAPDGLPPASPANAAAVIVIDETVASYEMGNVAITARGLQSASSGTRVRLATAIAPERIEALLAAITTPHDARETPTDDVATAGAPSPMGEIIWRFGLLGGNVTGGGAKSKAALGEDTVYFTGYDGRLYAVDRTTGDLVWDTPLPTTTSFWVEVALAPDTVFYRDVDDPDGGDHPSVIGAVARADGAALWTHELPQDEGSTPAPARNGGAPARDPPTSEWPRRRPSPTAPYISDPTPASSLPSTPPPGNAAGRSRSLPSTGCHRHRWWSTTSCSSA
jgi:hypothetical protein